MFDRADPGMDIGRCRRSSDDEASIRVRYKVLTDVLEFAMTERMKIGVFTEFLPYLPARDGFRVYEANLLRELSHRHELHLISLVREEDLPHKSWSENHFASTAFVE